MAGLDRGAVAAALGAYVIWGTSPLFFKATAHVPPLELLAHRSIWTLALLGGFSLATGRGGRIRAALADPAERPWLLVAGAMAAANWFLFIVCIQTGRALEASLAYWIFPLVAVAVGAAAFRERLGRVQAVAVGLAAAAVALLTWGLGAPPWFALGLAGAFSVYGVAKRLLKAGPITSVAIEALLMAPLAIVWLLGAHLDGWALFPDGRGTGLFGRDLATSALLVASGAVTAAPLLLFAHAAQRLDYGTVGLMQYLNPTLQLLLAALVFGEVVTVWHAAALPMIWLALALYTGSALLRRA
jgi:chloramphenicol-sensitive protein RarD